MSSRYGPSKLSLVCAFTSLRRRRGGTVSAWIAPGYPPSNPPATARKNRRCIPFFGSMEARATTLEHYLQDSLLVLAIISGGTFFGACRASPIQSPQSNGHGRKPSNSSGITRRWNPGFSSRMSLNIGAEQADLRPPHAATVNLTLGPYPAWPGGFSPSSPAGSAEKTEALLKRAAGHHYQSP